MMETKKEDLLKLENLEKNEYLVTASIIDEPVEKIEKKQRKITLFNLIAYSLLINKYDEDNDLYQNIKLNKTLKVLILLLLTSALMFLFYKICEIRVILPIILLFASIGLPLLLITFHYELCLKQKTSLFQLILSLTFGIILYIAIKVISDTILIKAIYEQTINMIIIPVLWGIGELILSAILSRMQGVTDTASGILIAVCIGMGYMFCWCFYELFSSFFILVEVTVEGGVGQYLMYAIIDEPTFIEQGFNNMLSKVLMYCVYYPIMFNCWSVIVGNITASESFRVKKKDNSTSLYLLVVLVVVLYALSVFTTSFASFDIILKILCLLVSLFTAIRIENSVLNNTLLKKSVNDQN